MTFTRIKRVLLALLGLMFAGLAQAQTAPVEAAGEAPPAIPELTAETAEKWAEEVFGEAWGEKRFSGAAVAIVKDGELLFSRGYGFADYLEGRPMDPANSLVRVCSTTKLFVATALMQLVDRGQIASLDDPANKYLTRITLPDTANGPITIRDLTSHRGGFEDSYFNAGTAIPVQAPASAATLQRLIPKIVRPSGGRSVYSNAATALQGALIEDVTGMRLADYLAENVLGPLGMEKTQLSDNWPPPGGAARSHIFFEDGSARQVPLVSKHPVYAPSGGLYSTPEDMARFVAAHLDRGRSTNQAILSAQAFDTMHTPFARNHPRMGALGVQFFIDEVNGSRVINHGCGLPGFTSYLGFIPDQNAGVFVSVISSSEPGGTVKELLALCKEPDLEDTALPVDRAGKFYWSFLERFVGFADPVIDAGAEADLTPYVGAYKVERRPFTNMLLALELYAPDAFMIDITAHEEGGISLNGGSAARGIGDGLFQRGNHPGRVYGFDVGADGRMQMLNSATQVYTKVSWWQDSRNLRLGLGLAVLVLGTGLAFAIGAPASRDKRIVRLGALAVLLMALAAIAVVTAGYPFGKNIEHYVNEGGTVRLWAIVIIANLMALSGLAIAAFAWRDARGWVSRVHAALLSFAAVALIFVLWSSNLIGFAMP